MNFIWIFNSLAVYPIFIENHIFSNNHKFFTFWDFSKIIDASCSRLKERLWYVITQIRTHIITYSLLCYFIRNNIFRQDVMVFVCAFILKRCHEIIMISRSCGCINITMRRSTLMLALFMSQKHFLHNFIAEHLLCSTQ